MDCIGISTIFSKVVFETKSCTIPRTILGVLRVLSKLSLETYVSVSFAYLSMLG